MKHDRYGYWLDDVGPVEPTPSLKGEQKFDVAIVGGGYLGMWTAWSLLDLDPELKVAVLEAEICGNGPSGRNGGFLAPLWFALPDLVKEHGDQAAHDLTTACADSINEIATWCETNAVDAEVIRSGEMLVATSRATDGRWKEVVDQAGRLDLAHEYIPLSADRVRERCASPAFLSGVIAPVGGTVHPAKLARGLRQRLIDRGVRIFEQTPVDLESLGPVLTAPNGTVRANSVVLAINAASVRVRKLAPRITLTSSHIVVTEPVPDVLEEIGWTGGEAIADARAFLHYFRTTRDGRIVFGWGGGRIVFGDRISGYAEVDPSVIEQTRSDLVRYFPRLNGRKITHAWGGPIDISPSHLPIVGTLPNSPIHYGMGFTGNGVAPSQLVGKILARMATDRKDELTELAIVNPKLKRIPPEPFRYFGGSLVRAASLRRERLEEENRKPDRLTEAIANIPNRMGIHIGR